MIVRPWPRYRKSTAPESSIAPPGVTSRSRRLRASASSPSKSAPAVARGRHPPPRRHRRATGRCRRSAKRSPSAETIPGSGGTMTSGISSSTARSAQWSPPAPPNEIELHLARVVAALDRHQTERGAHVAVGDAQDPCCRLLCRRGRAARRSSIRTARRASSTSIDMRPPRNASGLSRPSTTFASPVFVGSVPPCP